MGTDIDQLMNFVEDLLGHVNYLSEAVDDLSEKHNALINENKETFARNFALETLIVNKNIISQEELDTRINLIKNRINE